MEPPVRFELTTFRLQGECSNQLSQGGIEDREQIVNGV